MKRVTNTYEMAKFASILILVVVIITVQGVPARRRYNEAFIAASEGHWDRVHEFSPSESDSMDDLELAPGLGDTGVWKPGSFNSVRDLKPVPGGHVFGEAEYSYHSASNINGKTSEDKGGHKIINDDGKIQEFNFTPSTKLALPLALEPKVLFPRAELGDGYGGWDYTFQSDPVVVDMARVKKVGHKRKTVSPIQQPDLPLAPTTPSHTLHLLQISEQHTLQKLPETTQSDTESEEGEIQTVPNVETNSEEDNDTKVMKTVEKHDTTDITTSTIVTTDSSEEDTIILKPLNDIDESTSTSKPLLDGNKSDEDIGSISANDEPEKINTNVNTENDIKQKTVEGVTTVTNKLTHETDIIHTSKPSPVSVNDSEESHSVQSAPAITDEPQENSDTNSENIQSVIAATVIPSDSSNDTVLNFAPPQDGNIYGEDFYNIHYIPGVEDNQPYNGDMYNVSDSILINRDGNIPRSVDAPPLSGPDVGYANATLPKGGSVYDDDDYVVYTSGADKNPSDNYDKIARLPDKIPNYKDTYPSESSSSIEEDHNLRSAPAISENTSSEHKVKYKPGHHIMIKGSHFTTTTENTQRSPLPFSGIRNLQHFEGGDVYAEAQNAFNTASSFNSKLFNNNEASPIANKPIFDPISPISLSGVRDLKPPNNGKVYGEAEYTYHTASKVNGQTLEDHKGHKIINDNGKVEEYDFTPRPDQTPGSSNSVRDLKPVPGGHVYGEAEYSYHSASNINGKTSENKGSHKIINDDGKIQEFNFTPNTELALPLAPLPFSGIRNLQHYEGGDVYGETQNAFNTASSINTKLFNNNEASPIANKPIFDSISPMSLSGERDLKPPNNGKVYGEVEYTYHTASKVNGQTLEDHKGHKIINDNGKVEEIYFTPRPDQTLKSPLSLLLAREITDFKK